MEVYPPPMPYQICKIEELRKVSMQCHLLALPCLAFIYSRHPQNSKGSVEVAAKCFYRRKDLPPNLLVAADRHAS